MGRGFCFTHCKNVKKYFLYESCGLRMHTEGLFGLRWGLVRMKNVFGAFVYSFSVSWFPRSYRSVVACESL